MQYEGKGPNTVIKVRKLFKVQQSQLATTHEVTMHCDLFLKTNCLITTPTLAYSNKYLASVCGLVCALVFSGVCVVCVQCVVCSVYAVCMKFVRSILKNMCGICVVCVRMYFACMYHSLFVVLCVFHFCNTYASPLCPSFCAFSSQYFLLVIIVVFVRSSKVTCFL